MIWYIAAFVAGLFVGFLVEALCVAASRRDWCVDCQYRELALSGACDGDSRNVMVNDDVVICQCRNDVQKMRLVDNE